jgi:hypothetical protein
LTALTEATVDASMTQKHMMIVLAACEAVILVTLIAIEMDL